MLWTIFFVLAIMWLLGFSLNVGGGLIHLLLLVALVVLLFNFLGGRRVTGKDTAGISNRRGGLADLFPFYSFGESRAVADPGRRRCTRFRPLRVA